MTDPLTPDDATESTGAKQNFIGRVVDNSVDGLAQAALDAGYNESSGDYETDIDHFAFIKILDGTYDKSQNVYSMNVRSGNETKWMVMMMHLTDVHGRLDEHGVDSAEDVLEFMKGRVYEWRDITWTEDEEYPIVGEENGITYADIGENTDPDNLLVPVREVTDEDELMDLGVEVDTGDVEEVDI